MDVKELKRGERLLVSDCFLFKNMSLNVFNGVLSDDRCILVKAKKGDVLSEIVDYRRSLGIVLAGSLYVSKPSSRRYTMNTLTRGNIFGAADLYDCGGEEAFATVLTAASDSRLILFPLEFLEELMRGDFTVAENYIRFLTDRVRFLNEKIDSLVTESADAALARYLIKNVYLKDGKLIVGSGGSMQALAEKLNMGRASLYRAFESLENGGLIVKNGREIEIINLERLKIQININEG